MNAVIDGAVITGSAPDVGFTVILDEENGSFTVKGRITGHSEIATVTVSWSASRGGAEGLFVYPAAADIKTGERLQLQCSENGRSISPVWSSPPNSSVVNGLFTSDYAGVYRVTASAGGKTANSVILVS